jgi:hypothetical protein
MSPCGLSVNDGVITHLLSQIPYEPLPAPDVKMPEPPSHHGYIEPDSSKPNIKTLRADPKAARPACCCGQ